MTSDKNSGTTETITESLGSKVDFSQLIKSLVDTPTISVNYFNAELANVFSDFGCGQDINEKYIGELRELAEKTDNEIIKSGVDSFEQRMRALTIERELAEEKAEKERQLREEQLKELKAVHQSNRYLSATRNTSEDVQDLIHVIDFSSSKIKTLFSSFSESLSQASIDRTTLMNRLDEIMFYVNRIDNLGKMLTKTDTNTLNGTSKIDIKEYIKEYISNFESSIHVVVGDEYEDEIIKRISTLDLSVVIDNLVSNSKKANATTLRLDFKKNANIVDVFISDDGIGVDLQNMTSDSIFLRGVTDRPGGAGVGLGTIKKRMEKDLNGDVEFVGNSIYLRGATFKLTFK